MSLISFNATTLTQWLDGECVWRNYGSPVSVVGTDTRTLPPQSCFFAIVGETHNGHQFLDDAIARGARILVVERGQHSKLVGRTGIDVIAVTNTTTALGRLARQWRRQWGGPAVVITGSNGKTTTKEYTAAALETSGSVLRTPGNWNNHIGLPLTIFGLQDQHFAVLEIGTNAPGEIATLADIAQPNVAIITNIAPAHLLGLGSIDGVAKEKTALFQALPPYGTAVVNTDDPRVVQAAKSIDATKITYGTKFSSDVRILEPQVPLPGRMIIRLSVAGRPLTQEIAGFGSHMASNVAAAVGAAMALSISPDVALAGIATATAASRRMTLRENQGVFVLDDCYNANPGSMAVALRTLADIKPSGRRFAVLGDMLELGDHAPNFHQQLGAQAAQAGLHALIAVGQFANDVIEGAKAAGFTGQCYIARSHEDAVFVADLVQPGDWLLVKGSRGVALENIVDAAIKREKD